jgi:hypothetical protein
MTSVANERPADVARPRSQPGIAPWDEREAHQQMDTLRSMFSMTPAPVGAQTYSAQNLGLAK